jgi:hypothetical protein
MLMPGELDDEISLMYRLKTLIDTSACRSYRPDLHSKPALKDIMY